MNSSHESRPPKETARGAGRRTTQSTRPLGNVHDALSYTAWGWHVLPIRPGTKLPATSHGFHDASNDPDQVLDWWDRDPAYGIGVATGAVSGLVVLDVDPGGLETLSALVTEHGPLPSTLKAQTPRGGWHGYYAHPGRRVRCTAGVLGANLDVRGDGGYVVAPESEHPNGGTYRWWEPHDWTGTVADLPAAWVDLLADPLEQPTRLRPPTPTVDGVTGRAAAYVTAAVRGQLEDVAAAAEGTRNARLNQAAFRLGQLAAAGALDPDAAHHSLSAAAAVAGLDAREADRTIRSGFVSGLEHPAELPSEVAA